VHGRLGFAPWLRCYGAVSGRRGGHARRELLWHLEGYDLLLYRARRIIGEARRELYLSAWRDQVVDLQACDAGIQGRVPLPCTDAQTHAVPR